MRREPDGTPVGIHTNTHGVKARDATTVGAGAPHNVDETAICDMIRVASHGRASRAKFLGQAAQRYAQHFRASDSRFGCMQAIETALGVPRVKAARVRFRLGRRKGLSEVEQFALSDRSGAVPM